MNDEDRRKIINLRHQYEGRAKALRARQRTEPEHAAELGHQANVLDGVVIDLIHLEG
jgi:hypothetical protein